MEKKQLVKKYQSGSKFTYVSPSELEAVVTPQGTSFTRVRESQYTPQSTKGVFTSDGVYVPIIDNVKDWQRIADYTKQEMPTDALSYNPKPSVYLGDDKVAQQLFNDRLKAEANAAYGVFRFLPWTKYATDIADVRGMSPDTDLPDFSDVSGISAPLFDLMADKLRYDNLNNARIGRKINLFMHPKTKQFVSRGFSLNVIDGMNDQYQRNAGKWKTAKKLAPFRFVDLTSDIHLGLVNLYKLKKSIERESKYTERKASLDPQFKYKKKNGK